jgi:hypothetical protein
VDNYGDELQRGPIPERGYCAASLGCSLAGIGFNFKESITYIIFIAFFSHRLPEAL